jgi:hypothetical protein
MSPDRESDGPMSPDHPPDNRPPDDGAPHEDDARDERLAALLEVPPLDDVTRRQLVRRALDEPGARPDRRRLIGALSAAAAALVVVLGTAIVLRDGGGGGDTTAARPAGGRDAEDQSGKETTDEAAAAPSTFVDLGEVSDPVVLRERLGALVPAHDPPAGSEDSGGTDERDTAAAAVPPECLTVLDRVGAGPPTVVAGGTYQGAPALVLVAVRTGSDTAFVLDAATCDLRSEVPLV